MRKNLGHIWVAAVILSGASAFVSADIGTAFTYQGSLENPPGSPVSDTCDFRFRLFATAIGGTQQGNSPQLVGSVLVDGGVFTTLIDFGPGAMNGDARWMEIEVQCTGDPSFVLLTPRVELTPAPHALLSDQAKRAEGVFRVEPDLLGISGVGFGNNPNNLCLIATDSNGPSGLLLRDPAGIRVLRPAAAPPGPDVLRFGPTDDCSLGIEPGLPGLVGRDPSGLRLMGDAFGDGRRLVFGGPGDDCSLGVDSSGATGLTLRDPGCVRILNPVPGSSTKILFGPTDDCSIGIDPAMPGLVGRDPVGLRLIGDGIGGRRLIFGGPGDDCSIGIANIGSSGQDGVEIRDIHGARIVRPPLAPPGPTQLRFGPTDDCSLGIDPTGPSGLLLRDPGGIRVLTDPLVSQPRIGFGNNPDNVCMISAGPGGPPGMTLRDPGGVRLENPEPMGAVRLNFGNNPDNICAIAVDPAGPSGLTLRDVSGVRVLNPSPLPAPARLLFGPTDDCSLGIDPLGPSGLALRDPSGIRVLNPNPALAPRILFGPTDDCSIGVDMSAGNPQGLCFSDPIGFSFKDGFVGFGVTPATFRIELPNLAGPAGQGFANAWINGSSKRWKENVRPISNPLRTLSRLQGVAFDWKSEQGGKPDIGFIAEDVGAVLPQIVSWEQNGVDAKGVDYTRIVPVLVEALKEQQKQIESLDQQRGGAVQRNRELEERLTALEAQMDRLLNQGKEKGR